MKKVKLIINIVFIMMFILIMTNNVYAGGIGNIMEDADAFLKKDQNIVLTDMPSFSNTLYSVLFSIGLVIAVIVGAILGIQYMISATEEKAKTKEHLFSYFVGCAVLFGAFGIWKIVVVIFNDM